MRPRRQRTRDTSSYFYRGFPFLLRRGQRFHDVRFAFIANTCLRARRDSLIPRLIVPTALAQVRRTKRGDSRRRRGTMRSVDDTRANPRCTVLSVRLMKTGHWTLANTKGEKAHL